MASPPRSRASRTSSTTKGRAGGNNPKGRPGKAAASKRSAPKQSRKTAGQRSRGKKGGRVWSHPVVLGTALMAVFLLTLGLGGKWLGWWDTPAQAPQAEITVQPMPRPDPHPAPEPQQQAMAYQGHVYEETPLPGVKMTDPPVASPLPPTPGISQASQAGPGSSTTEPAVSGPAVSGAAAPIQATPKAPSQPVALTVQATAPQTAALPSPAWLRNALPAPPTQGKAMVAVVIDDMGVDVKRSGRIIDLPGPLTTSFLTYASDLQSQANRARQHGHELMVHLPMEPKSTAIDPGPDVLRTTLSSAEIEQRLNRGLDSFTGYVGINNHMGSKFTEYTPGMTQVMKALKARGLLWLDSRTTPKSVGIELAQQWGVPHADRHVFLDNGKSVASVNEQLRELEQIALKHGYAIAIGHPHDQTIAAISAWLPTLAKKGIVLVPISTIVRANSAIQG